MWCFWLVVEPSNMSARKFLLDGVYVTSPSHIIRFFPRILSKQRDAVSNWRAAGNSIFASHNSPKGRRAELLNEPLITVGRDAFKRKIVLQQTKAPIAKTEIDSARRRQSSQRSQADRICIISIQLMIQLLFSIGQIGDELAAWLEALYRDPLLHVTLMNTKYRKIPEGSGLAGQESMQSTSRSSRRPKHLKRTHFDAQPILENFGNAQLGTVCLSCLQLLQMSGIDESGYYKCAHQISIAWDTFLHLA